MILHYQETSYSERPHIRRPSHEKVGPSLLTNLHVSILDSTQHGFGCSTVKNHVKEDGGKVGDDGGWGFIVVQHPDEMKLSVNRRKVYRHRNISGKSRKMRRKGEGHPPTETPSPSPRVDRSLPSQNEVRAHEIRTFLVRRNSAFCMKVRELCFSLALFDDGAYYFALAEMALHKNRSTTYALSQVEDNVSLEHYTQAVAHLFGVVLGLASYDLSVGNMERWEMHMAGLELLINRRGGLHAYQSVYFQLSLWIDTTGSLILDQDPRFNIPLDIMTPYRQPTSSPLLENVLARMSMLGPQLCDMAYIMKLMTGLTTLYARQADSAEDDDDGDCYAIYCITRARTSYALLRLERVDQDAVQSASASKDIVLYETLRLTALLFLLRLAGVAPSLMSHHTITATTLSGICRLRFAVGPIIWGPLSELHGRRSVFLSTYLVFTLLTAGCALAPNIEGLIIMRFLAGAFGSSPLTIAGGILADIWPNEERGLAMIFFSSAPLFGPSLGPITGGFVGEQGGWRLQGNFGRRVLPVHVDHPSGNVCPFLLARRAERLTRTKGRVFISRLAKTGQEKALRAKIKEALVRPWVLLFLEPIVLLLTIYMAILYGTLYLFFAAFPIVYQEYRGWNQGTGGLSFLGLAVGIAIGIIVAMHITIGSTGRKQDHGQSWRPEIRLPMSLVGCISIPMGLF
ncbi:hypothetical protein S40288_10008 [Stachybotrys chartarum IBT 40288]|nr:hypothetical protein S40288_10008 [Stachybotrys chartarum IBT 40288]